jgi:hypothetical protein
MSIYGEIGNKASKMTLHPFKHGDKSSRWAHIFESVPSITKVIVKFIPCKQNTTSMDTNYMLLWIAQNPCAWSSIKVYNGQSIFPHHLTCNKNWSRNTKEQPTSYSINTQIHHYCWPTI